MQRLAVQCLLWVSRFILARATAATPGVAQRRRPPVRMLREPGTRARHALPAHRAFVPRATATVAA